MNVAVNESLKEHNP